MKLWPAALLLLACSSWEPPTVERVPLVVETAAPPAQATPQPGARLALPLGKDSLSLPAGRWAVMVTAPGGRYVSIGVRGPVDALRRFDVVAPKSLRRLRTGAADDDGKLPTFLSFATRDGEVEMPLIVDVDQPVKLFRVDGDPKAEGKQPLVGLPYPLQARSGYYLYAPTRYHFMRADVVRALRSAFKQTRVRYQRRKPIGIGDASQWNGVRPATDIGKPRHISHQGGRDIDIGLPASDDRAGALTRRCNGVLVEKDRLECAPGTVSHFDAERTAYLLGQLIDGPTPGHPICEVEAIFTDQAYIDLIRNELAKLRAKNWIHDDAFSALGEDGLLRPSPWHVDHIHIRFMGASAEIPKALEFAPQPSSD